MKLMCGLYPPTQGSIYINGVDCADLNPLERLNLFAVVAQNSLTFSFTIGENVALSESYRPERVVETLEKVGLHMLKDDVGRSVFSNYGENGIELSGGERQKLAIARALYQDKPAMVLDEPTAALDPKSESMIYENLNQLVKDKIVIFISHRLSSCQFCDEIVVLKDGRKVQYGAHSQLVCDEQGLYYQLSRAQAQYYSV